MGYPFAYHCIVRCNVEICGRRKKNGSSVMDDGMKKKVGKRKKKTVDGREKKK